MRHEPPARSKNAGLIILFHCDTRTGRLGSPRPQARREATGRPVVQMTTPLNTRPTQMCTCSARNGMHRADERIAAPKSVAGTFETCRCVEEMSEFEGEAENICSC